MDVTESHTGLSLSGWGRASQNGHLGGMSITPARITVIYLVLGMGALAVSDVFFVQLVSEPLLSQMQALKGGVEVVLTAGLIYGLTYVQRTQLEDAHARTEHHRDELQLLHRVVRHNLRNDINVVQGNVELIEDDVSSEESRERLEILRARLDKMDQHIQQLHRIRQVTDSDNGTHTVDLSVEIPRLIADHPQVTDDVAVTTSIPAGVEVSCNHMFREAASELITNGIKHNSAPTPEIEVEVDPSDGPRGMVALRSSDNGPGLPDGEIRALETDGEPALSHSTGLGLWLVNWMVTHSGGYLEAERPESGGTVITLYLPLSDGSYRRRIPQLVRTGNR